MTVPIEIAGPTCSCTGPWGDILRPRGDPQPISKWGGWQIIADPLPPTCAPPCGWIVDPAPPVAGLAILIFVPPPPFDGVNRDDAINLDGERKALRKIAQEAADAGGVTAKEAAILERWRAELGMPGHDVVSGHGAGVPNDSPWKTMPHWKVGGRDSIHVPIRGEQ